MSAETVNKALRDKVKSWNPSICFIGTVTEVDEANYTCDIIPLGGIVEVFKVRLKPTIDGTKKGIIAIPAKDSFVIVGLLDKNINSAFVVWCSNITKYYVFTEKGTFEMKDDGTMLLNGDDYAGLVKLQELKDNLDAIKNYLSAEKNAIIAGFNAIGAGMSANGANGTTAYNSAISSQTITWKDMENKKVKQGKGS